MGLNPPTTPSPYTSYQAFNDTPIIQYFKNSSNLVHPLSTDPSAPVPSDSSPIIGLPNTNYTDFHLMPLKDDIAAGMDVSYYGSLFFGTPGQDLTVSVDTGSADLWIPATCPSCSGSQFAPAASQTFRGSKRKVSLVYVSTNSPSLFQRLSVFIPMLHFVGCGQSVRHRLEGCRLPRLAHGPEPDLPVRPHRIR